MRATVRVSPAAADLAIRAEIRDVRDRIVQRTVVPLDATKETVDVAFDPRLLEHSANFLDVYLETDRVLDVKRLDFYRRVGTRRDFTIFTEEAPGSGQFAAKRRAYYEYHGVDCWQTDSMRPTAQWQGGDLVITLKDGGRPFNPLEHEAPDLSLPAEERPVGGLGIFLTRRMTDAVSYAYEDGCNILTLTKHLD